MARGRPGGCWNGKRGREAKEVTQPLPKSPTKPDVWSKQRSRDTIISRRPILSICGGSLHLTLIQSLSLLLSNDDMASSTPPPILPSPCPPLPSRAQSPQHSPNVTGHGQYRAHAGTSKQTHTHTDRQTDIQPQEVPHSHTSSLRHTHM